MVSAEIQTGDGVPAAQKERNNRQITGEYLLGQVVVFDLACLTG